GWNRPRPRDGMGGSDCTIPGSGASFAMPAAYPDRRRQQAGRMNMTSVLHRVPTPLLDRIAGARYRSPDLYGRNRDYRRFVLLGHQRTGSNLITSSLRRHPRVWCYSEVFNPRSIQFFTPGLPNDSSLLKVYRERDPLGFLERFVFRGYRPAIDAVGFKLFPEHMRPASMSNVLDALVADRDMRYVHVWRANHLRVLLSLELARQTEHWATKDGGHPPGARVVIEPDALLEFSARRRAEEAMLRERFADSPFHEVEYETLAADVPGELTRLQEFLGVEPVPLEPVLH